MIITFDGSAQICIHGAKYYIVYLYVRFGNSNEVTVLFQLVILYRIGQWFYVHCTGGTAFNKIRAITLISKYAKIITFDVEGADGRMVTHLLRNILEVFHYEFVGLAQHWIKCFLGPPFNIMVHSYSMNGAKSKSLG